MFHHIPIYHKIIHSISRRLRCAERLVEVSVSRSQGYDKLNFSIINQLFVSNISPLRLTLRELNRLRRLSVSRSQDYVILPFDPSAPFDTSTALSNFRPRERGGGDYCFTTFLLITKSFVLTLIVYAAGGKLLRLSTV